MNTEELKKLSEEIENNLSTEQKSQLLADLEQMLNVIENPNTASDL